MPMFLNSGLRPAPRHGRARGSTDDQIDDGAILTIEVKPDALIGLGQAGQAVAHANGVTAQLRAHNLLQICAVDAEVRCTIRFSIGAVFAHRMGSNTGLVPPAAPDQFGGFA